MTIEQRKQEIQWLVASGNTDVAVKRAMDFVKDFGDTPDFISQVMNLSRTWSASNRQTTDAAQLGFDILQLLENVEKQAGKNQKLLPPSLETVVILRGVQKAFLNNRFHLKPIDAEFKLGEITGVVGPNANGKSTLMRLIVGDLSTDAGELHFPQIENVVGKLDWDTLKHLVAYVPQEIPRWQGTLKNNLRYEAALHNIVGTDNETAVDYIIERLGLTRYAAADWSQLSGGYKLRFALARALVWKPTIVVLDEPLANLDVNAQTIVLNDLRALAHSFANPICILISSQHIHEIEHVSDNIIVLEEGLVKYMGKRADFGKDNPQNIFEISGDFDPSVWSVALKDFPEVIFRSHGYYYSLTTPKTWQINDIWSICDQNNIKLEYCRDISRSVKQMFLT
jgi:ABC-2 type transport system ATP-binding protein